MKHRWPIALLGLLVVLAVGSFAAWRWVEGRMQQALGTFQTRMAAEGWTVTVGATARAGWPLAAELVLDDVSFAANGTALPLAAGYAATRVRLRLSLRDPGAAQILLEGPQTVQFGTASPRTFTAETLTLTVPLTPGRPPERFGLQGSSLRFGAPLDGLMVGLLEGQVEWPGGRLSDLRVSAEAITLPPAMHSPLGPHIASATAEAEFAGMVPQGATSPAAAAAGWRDSGGAITLRRIAVGWGSLGVSGEATVRLDAALQPEATARLRLVGLAETLSALADAHLIAPRAAQTARIVLALMTHPAKDGEAPGVELPLTLQDRRLSLGAIPLGSIAELVWPDTPRAARVSP
jgi:hypothetical protein